MEYDSSRWGGLPLTLAAKHGAAVGWPSRPAAAFRADEAGWPAHLVEVRQTGVIRTGKAFTLRGCGFFHIVDGQIIFQRGYWDKVA